MAKSVLCHRIGLNFEAISEGKNLLILLRRFCKVLKNGKKVISKSGDILMFGGLVDDKLLASISNLKFKFNISITSQFEGQQKAKGEGIPLSSVTIGNTYRVMTLEG